MRDSTHYTQTIDHDVLSGVLKITEKEEKVHSLHDYILYDTDGTTTTERLIHKSYVDETTQTTKTYWLSNFMGALRTKEEAKAWEDGYGEGIILFETNGTAETQSIVTKIDGQIVVRKYGQSGSMTSEDIMEYDKTVYPSSDCRLFLIIHP
jgi:hypothetical protein